MKTHFLRGSKQAIAEGLVRIRGEVREAIVFEEEATLAPGTLETGNIFAEMGPFMVDVQQVNDSRSSIHTRLEGE